MNVSFMFEQGKLIELVKNVGLHEVVSRANVFLCRSINAQAEFWTKTGMLAEANPTLACTDIVKMQLQSVAAQTDPKID